jgi:hypothetical protein
MAACSGPRHSYIMARMRARPLVTCLFCLMLDGPFVAVAQERPTRTEVWDLKLGLAADALPDGFAEYACGSNGGPPGAPISGWRDFRRCRAEASGFHEVYFRYDDELEYWAKANNFTTEIEQFSGTKVYGFPVVLSALFDARGVLMGVRIVSDPRDASKRREDAHALRNFITARFGRDGWACADHPLADGETPVLRTFIKQDCSKAIDGVGNAVLHTRFLRKKGQSQYDPRTDRETEGQFESTVRFELMR